MVPWFINSGLTLTTMASQAPGPIELFGSCAASAWIWWPPAWDGKKKTVTTWAVGKSWLWNSMDLWIYYGYNWDLCILNPTGGMMFPSIISIS